jgi:hypothetical protein
MIVVTLRTRTQPWWVEVYWPRGEDISYLHISPPGWRWGDSSKIRMKAIDEDFYFPHGDVTVEFQVKPHKPSRISFVFTSA